MFHFKSGRHENFGEGLLSVPCQIFHGFVQKALAAVAKSPHPCATPAHAYHIIQLTRATVVAFMRPMRLCLGTTKLSSETVTLKMQCIGRGIQQHVVRIWRVGDFLAIPKLTLPLVRVLRDAVGEFEEIGRELSLFYTILSDLEDQAGDPKSLLNRWGSSRREEVTLLCELCIPTLYELQYLHRKCRQLGRNAWKRVRLGEEHLEELRSKL